MTDTIFAVSSGQPPAAIAVMRVSGPDAMVAATGLAGRLPPPRQARLRALRDKDGVLLDRALLIVFPGPATATGEDLVELHCHGGRAVVAAVEGALAGAGCRRAYPGEFTRRALANGRLDLAQAEALADLLEAETEAQRLAALDGVEGRVGTMLDGWMTRVAGLAARVEATLDFADEDDVGDEGAELDEVIAAMQAAAQDIVAALDAPSIERLRDGVRVVIAGPPNAGKSTLLNLLAAREAAIVSPIAGTTRDRVEAAVVRAGAAYILTDTAGLTETHDPIEAIGVARAQTAIDAADVLLWLGDDPPPRSSAVWIRARSDLPGRDRPFPGEAASLRHDDLASVDHVWRIVATRAAAMTGRGGVPALRERQRDACRLASDALASVLSDPLLLAEQLRRAHGALASATGVNATEAMLDQLFGRFCIGK